MRDIRLQTILRAQKTNSQQASSAAKPQTYNLGCPITPSSDARTKHLIAKV